MTLTDKYILDYQSLPLGEHVAEIQIGNELFESVVESEVVGANLKCVMDVKKHHNFAELAMSIEGLVTTPCDRCLDDVIIPVKTNANVIIRVSDFTPETQDPDVIYISPNEHTVDLAHYIYETIMLALPVARAHADMSQCNPDVVKFITAQVEPDSQEEEEFNL